MPGCSIFRASASRARPCRCCSIWRAPRICRGAWPRCFAAIRSTAPSSARCCTRRCAPSFAGSGGGAGGSARVAQETGRFRRRGAFGQEARDHRQAIQAGGEHRHRRLGLGAAAGVRCAQSGVERRHHAALRVERGSHPTRGSHAQHRSRGNVGHRVLEDVYDARDAGECQRGAGVDRRRARREVSRESLCRCFNQCRSNGCLRHRRRSSLHPVGLGGRALFGVVGDRPDRRAHGRQRPLRRIPEGCERHRQAFH